MIGQRTVARAILLPSVKGARALAGTGDAGARYPADGGPGGRPPASGLVQRRHPSFGR